MTPREPHPSLRRDLRGGHRALLAAWAARCGLAALGLVAGVLAAALVLGALLPSGPAAAWARLIAVIALGLVALALAVARYSRAAMGFDAYLERLETAFPELRSWLRNALDFQARPPRDTSVELAGALSREAAIRLSAVPLGSLRPPLEARRPLAVLLIGLVAVAGLGLALPGRVSRSWATLWNPALAAAPLRLEVEPGSVRITPGAALAVRARVWGSARRPVLLRDGHPALAAIPDGRTGGALGWHFDLTQLTREQDYRVRVAGVESPRYHIALSGEPMPVGFEVEYRSPAYARLPVQRGAATRGDLTGLRGTRARVEVTFDRDLTGLTARLPGGATQRWEAASARRWRGEIALDREGDYELDARALAGEGRYRYRITPVPDAPPVIAVRVPTGDVDLPAGQQIPVEVLGQDDLGLSALRLQYRKDPSAPWTELPLARFADRPREASVQARWDASTLALLPGEVATFRFELLDNNLLAGPGRAVSPTFELRFPSLGELYERIDQSQGGVQQSLEKVAEQAHELQQSLDRLGRQPARPNPESAPAFERSAELKSALERQQQLSAKVDEAAAQLRQSLEQAAERQAFNQELTRKLKEMSELMDQIQSKEFKDAMRRMQEALERLDPRALEQNLPEWREQNRNMLANLERTIDLLKQLREEERLQALARRAEELKARQDALNREHDAARQPQDAQAREAAARALAEQQERAAEESRRLGQDVREAEKEMGQAEAKERLERAASELDPAAAKAQHDASKSASQGERSAARRTGEQASENLENAAQQLSEMVKNLQQRRASVDLAAVRRAAQDLVSLQREAEGNLGSADPVSRRADRQTDLSEGVSRVADSLFALAHKTPFISPKLGEALGRAINNLSSSGKELGLGNRQQGEATGRMGSTALNEAVLELRSSEKSMCQNPGKAGEQTRPGSSVQRLGELGEQQSQLNGETRTLAQRLSEQMRLSAGDREQLDRMAQQQRRIREQLEQIQRDEESRRQLLGRLDATRKDMQEVEETLRSGTHDGELEQKQQHILSRLLDAQRSVNRRDFDPERESRPGGDIARASAPELPLDLLREHDRLRLDLLKAGADRYPTQYRAFIEAYLRRLNGSRP